MLDTLHPICPVTRLRDAIERGDADGAARTAMTLALAFGDREKPQPHQPQPPKDPKPPEPAPEPAPAARRLACAPAIAALLVVGACAKSPSAVEPVAMPATAYDSMSCPESRAAFARVNGDVSELSDQQRAAVASDAIGVFLIGVPTASLTGGDRAGDLATAKGKRLALKSRLARCEGGVA